MKKVERLIVAETKKQKEGTKKKKNKEKILVCELTELRATRIQLHL